RRAVVGIGECDREAARCRGDGRQARARHTAGKGDAPGRDTQRADPAGRTAGRVSLAGQDEQREQDERNTDHAGPPDRHSYFTALPRGNEIRTPGLAYPMNGGRAQTLDGLPTPTPPTAVRSGFVDIDTASGRQGGAPAPRTRARCPVFIHTLQPPAPAFACSGCNAGSRNHDCGSKRSPASSKLPSTTRSSAPPGLGSETAAPGAHRSSRTYYSGTRQRGITSMPARSRSGRNGILCVSIRTCVRSSGPNCHTFTKMVQPAFEPGLCADVGGLRM